MRTGVLAVNGRHEIVLMNPSAQAILGLDASLVVGRGYRDVLAAYPKLVSFLSDALSVRTVLDRVEIPLSEHPPLTIGIAATPLSDPAGSEAGVVILFKDLTQIERAEEQAQLKERLVALGQMAAGLAHEMRNPLASIKVTVGLLQRTLAGDPDADKKLRSIMGNAQRLSQSVTDCLAFARPIRVEPKYVHIHDILEKVLGQAISLEHTHPFQTKREFVPDLPKTWVDPQQLEIVFFNLLNNAIDAVRHRHGTIVISTGIERRLTCRSEMIVTTISDNGEGIPADRLPKVFMPFFTTKGKGSGLGLANAKKIIDHLHGTIDVVSEPGVSTRFTVRIPVVTTPATFADAA